MIREGGWAMPLECDSPHLQSWLRKIQTVQRLACAVIGIQCGAANVPQTCAARWTPLAIMLTLAILVVSCCLLMAVVLRLLFRLYRRRRGSVIVSAAAAAAAELRHQLPAAYPPVPHSWYRLAPGDTTEPLLCTVCFQRVNPDTTLGSAVSCCELCGVVVHDTGCIRLAAHDCRPICQEGPDLPHHWRPAACLLPDLDEEAGETEPELSMALCIYCQRPCVTDFTSLEPIWDCAACRDVCHVGCYSRYHEAEPESPNASAPPNRLRYDLEARATSNGQATTSSGQATTANGQATTASGIPKAPRSPRKGSAGSADRAGKESNREPPERTIKHSRRWSLDSLDSSPTAAMESTPLRRASLSLGRLLGGWVGSGGDAASSSGSMQAHMRGSIKGMDVAALDRCILGKHRQCTVPPTCVTCLPGATWTGRARQLVQKMADRARPTAIRRRPSRSLDGASSQELETPPGSRHKRGWKPWSEARVSWQNYTIGPLPAGCKPLLVFLNTRSGPQTGLVLRRRFLRRLNPLQVVELPREDPAAALHLFARVANLRLLVVGGDGTVGWILSCLDSLAAELAKEKDAPHWTPPPVSVFPLGTGNDLARVLRWGGGLHMLQQRGMAGLLSDIQHAAIALLDRWEVAIQPAPPTPSRGALALPSSRHQEPAMVKAMNNYLGIGVDAKVALDFHSLRESYPHWFRSQMGNKLWYTTLGAGDILGRASRDLPKRIKLECDGAEVELPEDIEGIVLCNINSYMGGVDLWASGHEEAPSSPAGYGKQSYCDGMLEVVAVNGSWHLGQLQVGLSRAIRLGQCHSARITLLETTPLQVDGEPWLQGPGVVEVQFKGHALMLQRVDNEPQARILQAVLEGLSQAEQKGIISPAQRHALTAQIAAELHTAL